MSKAPPPLNVVHEAETQRQHVRVRVPGVVIIETRNGEREVPLIDLSAGGLGFNTDKARVEPGQQFSARIRITIQPIDVSLPVRFSIRHYDPHSGRAGAAFEALDAAQVSTLRRIVGACLNGELIGVGEVMHALSRNNFTAPRGNKLASSRTAGETIRAALITLAMFGIGLAALSYTFNKLSNQWFGAHSAAARVSGPTYAITMPRDGVFRSLIPEDGIVRKGAPIGTFESSMFDLVRAQIVEAGLDVDDLDGLLDRSIKGTITSPCDCRVMALHSADGQYLSQGSQVVTLEPTDFDPYVVARFGYPEADRLSIGTPVKLRIEGDDQTHRGHITQLRRGRGEDVLNDDLVVIVRPDQPIRMDLMSRAVKVSAISDEPMLDAPIRLLTAPAREQAQAGAATLAQR